jgi:chromosome segregation ATPase
VLTQEKESLQIKINQINTKVDEVTKAFETLRTETVKMKEELTKQRDEAIDRLQTTNKTLEELKNNWDQQTQRNKQLEEAIEKMREIIDTAKQNEMQ